MSDPKVVLASASPRRRELLHLIGIAHDVRPANLDETMRPRETPRRHAERLARDKAIAIAQRDPDLITIGADTIVVIDRNVLGKPVDEADAARMLAIWRQTASRPQVRHQPLYWDDERRDARSLATPGRHRAARPREQRASRFTTYGR